MINVERCFLVRVFAVAESLGKATGVEEAFAKNVIAQRCRQVFRDRRVVTRGMRIGLRGKSAPVSQFETIALEFFEAARGTDDPNYVALAALRGSL